MIKERQKLTLQTTNEIEAKIGVFFGSLTNFVLGEQKLFVASAVGERTTFTPPTVLYSIRVLGRSPFPSPHTPLPTDNA